MSGWKNDINTRRKVGMKRTAIKVKPISKATARKKIKKQLDTVAREICFAMYGRKCVTCGDGGELHWSHLFRREPESTRWHPLNTAVQCKSCHYYHHRVGNDRYTAWFLERYGQEQYQVLYRLHHATVKSTIVELDTMLNEKKNELARLLIKNGSIPYEEIAF